MCECCTDIYSCMLFYIFGILPRKESDIQSEHENYKEFLTKLSGSFTEVDLENTNPLYMRR